MGLYHSTPPALEFQPAELFVHGVNFCARRRNVGGFNEIESREEVLADRHREKW